MFVYNFEILATYPAVAFKTIYVHGSRFESDSSHFQSESTGSQPPRFEGDSNGDSHDSFWLTRSHFRNLESRLSTQKATHENSYMISSQCT